MQHDQNKPRKGYTGPIQASKRGRSFTPKFLEETRADLDLSVEDFAHLLLVPFNTVYVWERAEEPFEVEGLASRVLTILGQMRDRHPDLRWADDVRRATEARGGLYGLYRLLSHYYRSMGLDKAPLPLLSVPARSGEDEGLKSPASEASVPNAGPPT